MRKNVASFAAIAFFSLLLAGTSKAPTGTSVGPSSAPTTSGVPTSEPTGGGVVPSSAGWPTVTLPKAHLQLSMPHGWQAFDSPAGDGEVEVMFGDHSEGGFKPPPHGVSGAKWVHAMRNVAEKQGSVIVFHADDAIIVHTKKLGEFGTATETTACASAGSREYCGSLIGMSVDGGASAIRGSDERAFQFVAITRSMKAAP